MSLDFLRFLAFEGELKNFFLEDYFNLSERATGISLKFHDTYLRYIARMSTEFYKREHLGSDIVENQYEKIDFATLLSQAIEFHWDREWTREEDEIWTRRWSPNFFYYGKDHAERRKSVVILVDVNDSERYLLTEGPREFEGFPIRYRLSNAMNPQFISGTGIKAGGATGTITSIVHTPQSGQIYGLMSGHVAGSINNSVTAKGGKAHTLGTVIALQKPDQVGPCSRIATSCDCSVDAAIFEMSGEEDSSKSNISQIRSIAAITQGDLIKFSGTGTGSVRRGVVLSATIWKKMDFGDGHLVCCGDLFEVSHTSQPYVWSPFSKPGDSGAPIMGAGTSQEWFGMIIGGERNSTFSCYAENVADWASKALDSELTFAF